MAILTGRASPTSSTRSASALLAVLREAFARAWDERPCDITVDIREMPRKTYAKAMNERARKRGRTGDLSRRDGCRPAYRWNR